MSGLFGPNLQEIELYVYITLAQNKLYKICAIFENGYGVLFLFFSKFSFLKQVIQVAPLVYGQKPYIKYLLDTIQFD